MTTTSHIQATSGFNCLMRFLPWAGILRDRAQPQSCTLVSGGPPPGAMAEDGDLEVEVRHVEERVPGTVRWLPMGVV